MIGNHNKTPLLNTLVYDLEFPYGAVKKYAANIVAGNVLDQFDTDEFTPM